MKPSVSLKLRFLIFSWQSKDSNATEVERRIAEEQKHEATKDRLNDVETCVSFSKEVLRMMQVGQGLHRRSWQWLLIGTDTFSVYNSVSRANA